MRVTARADYALRALVELAARGTSGPVTAERLAAAQNIPQAFLDNVLVELRRAGIVEAQRGPAGGYWLSRPAEEISLAQVIRVIDGPLANVRGHRPERLDYTGTATPLQDVWIALRAREREILEAVTVADVAKNQVPKQILSLATAPDAVKRRQIPT